MIQSPDIMQTFARTLAALEEAAKGAKGETQTENWAEVAREAREALAAQTEKHKTPPPPYRLDVVIDGLDENGRAALWDWWGDEAIKPYLMRALALSLEEALARLGIFFVEPPTARAHFLATVNEPAQN